MIKILDYTKNPLTRMGEVAGICTGKKGNANIGRKCLEANHGRVLEYVDVTLVLSDYSARVIRELYTHIVGVSRLQESTRYVDMSDFGVYLPDSIDNNEEAYQIYFETLAHISDSYRKLLELGIPKEDVANILPLAYHTKVVLKINLRALLHMFNERLCARAYKEFRGLMGDIKKALSELDDEWKEIIDKYAKPKCYVLGYCPEGEKSCEKGWI
jgi:thymidylate synthase (FAD)